MNAKEISVSPKELQQCVLDLQSTDPAPGIIKTLICAVAVFSFGFATWTSESWLAFVVLGAITGMCMSCWLITTHDALHHTLTGIRIIDEVLPRLISWPILWMHGTYSEIHKVHHRMNGDDFNDPERVQWTIDEYEQSGSLGKFYVRHQWFLDILVFGGIGLIWKTFGAGMRFWSKSRSVRRAMISDLSAIVIMNTLIYSAAASVGAGWRWLVMWFIVERFSGAVLQWRAHVEHYGLWGKGRNYYETQLYTCRNITSSAFGSWYFNRLNYHSVHHAFPLVPFNKLREAHQRLQDLFSSRSIEPLVQEKSYFLIAIKHAIQPSLIGPVNLESAVGAREMVRLDQLTQLKKRDRTDKFNQSSGF